MQEVTKYPNATFGWVDLATSEPEKAKTFYTALFGWDASDTHTPDGEYIYTMLNMHEKSVAGLGPLPPNTDAGHPAFWSSYLIVDSVDASVEQAEAAGATVATPPMEVMDQGRMAVLQDPTEAFFGLWQPGGHIGAQLVNIPGALCWNELYTRDPERAAKFYQDAFDWDFSTMDNGGATYWMFTNNERAAGGVMQMDDSWGDVPPHWGIYFAVADCAATVAKAKELGANVITDATEAPGTGTFAILQDPQGATFNVIAMTTADPMP